MDRSTSLKLVMVAAVAILVVVAAVAGRLKRQTPTPEGASAGAAAQQKALPRLVDLGSKLCIPCQMMEPILEELRNEYAGRLIVEFIDVGSDRSAASTYKISVIPTQIWFDASGRELERHEGFIPKEEIIKRFKKHGIELGEPARKMPEIIREEPLVPDTRPPEAKCFMCEGDINPKTRVTVRSPAGNLTHLCSPHCFFIMESCLLDKSSIAEVMATDFQSGERVAFEQAFWLYGKDARGRPTIKTFASQEAAQAEMASSGGEVLTLDELRRREYSIRCGFCDRVMYLQDNGSTVQVIGGPRTWGCCPHCALGVAARLGKDIIVEYNDPVSGQPIRIETSSGRIKSLDPPTAVAWFGQKKTPDGKFVSAGCFHQWNFANIDNLKKWLEAHPRETGRIYPIAKALEDKMRLSPEQISKACKIGECK